MKTRRRIKQTVSLEERLRRQAHSDRKRAQTLPAGAERDELLRRARRAETASHLSDWLSSPGLRSPTR
nr:hypothetical protein [Bradyrhizobium sp.]